MPLDTSTTYRLTRLRLDGRRWNELRLLQAQISTNPASSGSSYVTMGNTVVICAVHGPAEGKRSDAVAAGASGGTGASVAVSVNIAGFSAVDRKKPNERQSQLDLAVSLRDAFQPHLHTHVYPHSTINLHLSILSSDGSLLAACINASTLALIDAGIPMPGLLTACTIGMSGRASTPVAAPQVGGTNECLDPLLDLCHPEEIELPHMTIATTTPLPSDDGSGGGGGGSDDDEVGNSETGGENETVSIVMMESGVHVSYLETMFAVGIDGCKQVRKILDSTIRDSATRAA